MYQRGVFMYQRGVFMYQRGVFMYQRGVFMYLKVCSPISTQKIVKSIYLTRIILFNSTGIFAIKTVIRLATLI
jgi:ABC-type multidrug transport system permease subunit